MCRTAIFFLSIIAINLLLNSHFLLGEENILSGLFKEIRAVQVKHIFKVNFSINVAFKLSQFKTQTYYQGYCPLLIIFPCIPLRTAGETFITWWL